ncbi:hypothetical protein A9P82_02140 [Arachidicoccus ginsenosidimutans]|uniref:hypothetical protein n=1 Tax=Arachidicoccus sp. BS20 TaxID=1850526 RepID=UPI0007F089C8|nr:hypothetical protein [Arachidicoccus sp. BS20]ANI88213.1 hypothetical protein A9P82_02140 [Arachidicoccus sp. BS20]
MNAKETLLEALAYYKIKVERENDNHVFVQNNYEIEVEANGLYKLYDDGYVVAPFNDLNELCKFILT